MGAAINIGASFFWGSLFGAFLSSRPLRQPTEMLRDASIMGAIATLVDYRLVPKRLTPGWKRALSNRSVLLSMGAMTLGLAAGGLAAQITEDDLARRRRFTRLRH